MKSGLSSIILLAGVALAGCSSAPSVELHTSSPESELSQLWANFPDNLDKITYEWTGDVLHVHTVKTGLSGWKVEEKQTLVSIEGDQMRLCYAYVMDEEQMKLPAVNTALFPIALDFYVRGASRRDYQIAIDKNCGP